MLTREHSTVIPNGQAATEMHALTRELADTSDAIARTMAEAAAASLLAGMPQSQQELAMAATATDEAGASSIRDDPSRWPSRSVTADAADAASLGPAVGRSREDAQAEVGRLKSRQMELFDLIGDKREVISHDWPSGV